MDARRLDRAVWELRLRAGRREVWVTGLGGSMRPFLGEGDEVLLRPAPFGRLEPGSLVLVDLGPQGLALHRVLAVEGERALVKGDANPRPDGWFEASRLLARAVALRKLGGEWRLDSPAARLLMRAAAWASPHSARLARWTRPLRSAVRRVTGRASGAQVRSRR